MRLRYTGSRNRRLLIITGLLSISCLAASHAVLVKSEEFDLTSRSSTQGTISNSGGQFTSAGFVTRKGNDHAYIKLNKPIGKNDWAAVELHLTNFSPRDLAAELHTNFFGVYQTAKGATATGTPGSYMSLRCKGPKNPGTSGGFGCYRNGTYGQGLRAVFRPTTKGHKIENVGSYCCDTAWSKSKLYRFKIEFTPHQVRVYRDDIEIFGLPVFKRATEIAYVFFGHDKHELGGDPGKYGCMPGATYKKVIIYRDNGTPEPSDPLFAQDHIKINVGGYDDMVPGWPGALKYTTKGKEYQWGHPRINTDKVPNPPPLDIYRTIWHKNLNYNSGNVDQDSVEMHFPLRDGSWRVRFHLIDLFPALVRSIEADLNGKRVINDLDIRTESGATPNAIVKEFDVNVSGGQGLRVTMYDHDKGGDYFASGIEMVKTGAAPPAPQPEPTALNPAERSIRAAQAAQREVVQDGGIAVVNPAGRRQRFSSFTGVRTTAPRGKPASRSVSKNRLRIWIP